MSGRLPLATGSLGQVTATLGVEPIPVDGPGSASGRFWIVTHDVGVGDAEAEVTDGGKGLTRGAGHGTMQLVLRHRYSKNEMRETDRPDVGRP